MTQNAKHTSGPWIAIGRGIFAGDRILAEGKHPSEESAVPDYEEVIANIGLMALALDLLEALKASRAVLKSILGTDIENLIIAEQVAIIDSALAKAEVKP